ncbi:DNA-binding response OmpR family regulator [Oikeobacillus pervagus]|uniref:DNA-binding response OmpR family regulator n=1 Tax=Oikeobacillus pervagus TaxID=1325931 RepID=A0AAJ1WIJ9_9BACI|nr:response regulator transcription factor [Oikeobacillus pervagus]MDQ0214503.1 DNA-binding response OmpR family regulator [Oikeobacillus pervagus]
MRVLIVDDEEKITNVLASYFEKNGDHTYIAHTGESAIQIIDQGLLDMIILDLMLPDMAGEDICQYVKANYDIPVIMLTAKISIDDKVRGFKMGADDYVVKPFHPKEILVRAERLLPMSHKKQVITIGRLEIHKDERTVLINQQNIQFTPHEFNILLLLAENPKKVFSRDDIIQKLFGLDVDINPRIVDQHIKNIRKKVDGDYIQTVFGLGYKINEKVKEQ